jgi:hypothetical protein
MQKKKNNNNNNLHQTNLHQRYHHRKVTRSRGFSQLIYNDHDLDQNHNAVS